MRTVHWPKLLAEYSISTQLTIFYVLARGSVQSIQAQSITIEQIEWFIFNVENYVYCKEQLHDSVLAEVFAYGMELEDVMTLVSDPKSFDNACHEILQMLNHYLPVAIEEPIPITRFFSSINVEFHYYFLLIAIQGVWSAYREGYVPIMTCRNLLEGAFDACVENGWEILSTTIRLINNFDLQSDTTVGEIDCLVKGMNSMVKKSE